MNVLLLSSFDSNNYLYPPLYRALTARGHSCTIIVSDINDDVNNKMFRLQSIPVTSAKQLDTSALDKFDLAVVPHSGRSYDKLVPRLRQANVFIVSFARLFCSFSMRHVPDLMLALGEKHVEFANSLGLNYKTVITGSAQYDELIKRRREEPPKEIRRVLIIEQGAYPHGEQGKRAFAEAMCSLARKNPDIHFDLKPRYLPEEMHKSIHLFSYHCYDYFDSVPDNLTLLSEPSVLEEIMPGYDGMVVLYSTSFFDAALLGIPVLFVHGFPSAESFEIRNSLVEGAYSHIYKLGRVVEYTDIASEPLRLQSILLEELSKHVYKPLEPAAERITALFELACEQLVKPRLRLTGMFSLDYDAFTGSFEGLEKVSVDSERYKLEMYYLVEINRRLQAFTNNNRSLDYGVDTSRLLPYWSVKITEQTTREELDTLIKRLEADIESAFGEYFKTRGSRITSDPVLLYGCLNYLFSSKHFDNILSFSESVCAPEVVFYFRSIVHLLRNHPAEAAENYIKLYALVSSKDEKMFNFDYHYIMINGCPTIDKKTWVAFCNELLKRRASAELAFIHIGARRLKDYVTVYYAVKALSHSGDRETLEKYCRKHSAITLDPIERQKKKLGLTSLLIRCYHLRLRSIIKKRKIK